MTKQLLIMRHAKSDWDTQAASDFDRPLNPRGERNAKGMGQWLAHEGLAPGWMVCSPALRAKQTVLLIAEAWGTEAVDIHWEPAIYGADLGALLAVIGTIPEQVERAMLVGHNPGLESLVMYLAGRNLPAQPQQKRMPTAAMVCLDIDTSDLRQGSAQVLAMMRPKRLPPPWEHFK